MPPRTSCKLRSTRWSPFPDDHRLCASPCETRTAVVTPDVFTWVVPAVLAINLLTILCFATDKRAAERGGRRVRESTLLWLAAIGGSPAAFWARRRFRHKTRKQPFSLRLQLIAMTQAGMALGLGSLFF